MAYQLTNAAKEDIINIIIEGAERFGEDQAVRYHNRLRKTFDLLSDNPKMARIREELIPPIRIHPTGSHLILYKILQDGDILIIRIPHAHEDWVDNPLG